MSFLTLRGGYKIINAELSSQAEGLLTKCNYSCSFKNVNSNLDDFEIKDIFLEDKFSFIYYWHNGSLRCLDLSFLSFPLLFALTPVARFFLYCGL